MEALMDGGADAPEAAGDCGPAYECGVCWTVYDPAAGDPVWQVAPGTPFAALPSHWTCPNCAAERDRFLELGDA
jgi:rubredoxin